ncbi:hypothetical protein EYF80_006744 [Liparis tanakae]|uniref:Uncharacterized protein n=1 Tax=Liparis tanakae TaxID=230148 RepID=A0A4Z2IZF4_9TELE|nr:hypothetical protein EYF80_006744 [Liparis tanakae]
MWVSNHCGLLHPLWAPPPTAKMPSGSIVFFSQFPTVLKHKQVCSARRMAAKFRKRFKRKKKPSLKMWWGGFLSPGLSGYCGGEIGDCGGGGTPPPLPAHKKLSHPLSPCVPLTPCGSCSRTLWQACGLLRLPAGKEAHRGFKDARVKERRGAVPRTRH